MKGINDRLKQFKKLNMEATSDAPEAMLNNLEHLHNLNERFKEAEIELEARNKEKKKEEEESYKKNMQDKVTQKVPGLQDLDNLD